MKAQVKKSFKVAGIYMEEGKIYNVTDFDEECVIVFGIPYAIRKKHFILDDEKVSKPGLMSRVAFCTAGHEGACWFACRESCKCSCGGRNHGAGIDKESFQEAELSYLKKLSLLLEKEASRPL